MATPLRGEMTASTMPSIRPAVGAQSNQVYSLMTSLLSISSNVAGGTITPATSTPSGSPRLQPTTSDDAWLDNPQDTRLIQSTLLPYLLCLACSKNQPQGVSRIIKQIQAFEQPDENSGRSQPQEQSLMNLLDPAFGKNALHVAALNGHADCVEVLLLAGAHVHQRDVLGHTA